MASDSDKEEIAQLESESMAAVDQACLEMWHHVGTWLSNSEYSFFTVYLAYFINNLQICGVNNIRSGFLQSNMNSYQLYNNLKTKTTNINVSHAMLVLISC